MFSKRLVLGALALGLAASACRPSDHNPGASDRSRAAVATIGVPLLGTGATWSYWDNPIATTFSTTAPPPAVKAGPPPLDVMGRSWIDPQYVETARVPGSPDPALANGWGAGPRRWATRTRRYRRRCAAT